MRSSHQHTSLNDAWVLAQWQGGEPEKNRRIPELISVDQPPKSSESKSSWLSKSRDPPQCQMPALGRLLNPANALAGNLNDDGTLNEMLLAVHPNDDASIAMLSAVQFEALFANDAEEISLAFATWFVARHRWLRGTEHRRG
jgi:hypothetical protein